MKLNNTFLDKMKHLLGEEYDNFLTSLNDPLVKSIYVNESKIDVQKFLEIIDFDVDKIPYEKAGFYVDNDKKGRHPLHHAGAFYMQEPSAMFTVNALRFNGDEKVLDMCASPGGKSIQISNRIPNGILVSNEVVKPRAEILYSNIERMGLKNVVITNETPEKIGDAYGNFFDVCIVDAPCSGEGMFRRGDMVGEQWNENLPLMCANRQLEILSHADKTLKQGGYLIYSTCTYSLEENENVVNKFLEVYDYELVQIESCFKKNNNMPETVRLYPHKVKGEGQFVALLKKKAENYNSSYSGLKLTNSRFTNEFIRSNLNINFECYEYLNYNYYIPYKDAIKKHINYVSVGVRLGKMEGSRFEPHQNLFTAFGNYFKNTINLDFKDNNVKNYLRGDVVNCENEDGFGALLINGCAVGGYKISKGKFKNYYPKGLRNF